MRRSAPGRARKPDESARDRSRRYELLSCAWGGHALVGTDAADVTPDDALLVREVGRQRWHRCLRCDAWVPRPPPDAPARERVPPREEIHLPDRGPALRDKYVLRVISIERLFHVVVFGAVAGLLVAFGRHHAALRRDYQALLSDLSGGDPASVEARGLLGHLRSLFSETAAHVYVLAALAAGFALLEAIEAVGLWRARRWAEYLTFVATTLFVPFEVYELVDKFTVLRVLALMINLAVVLYLLVAKRLFGLRGGGRREEERRRQGAGWPAIERATPPPWNRPPGAPVPASAEADAAPVAEPSIVAALEAPQ